MQTTASSTSDHPLDRPVITGPRRCPSCDYELVGLRAGDRCPECGTPVRGGKITFADTTMAAAPVSYLRRLAIGGTLFSYGSVLAIIAFLVGAIRLRRGAMPWPEAIAATLAAAVMAAGIVLITAPRQTGGGERVDTALEYRAARLLARWCAWGWVIALGAIGVQIALLVLGRGIAGIFHPTRIAIIVGLLLGLVAAAAIALWIRHLSEWAGDTTTAERFKLLPLWIVVPIGPAMLALYFTPGIFYGPAATMAGLLMWGIAGLAIVWLLWVLHAFGVLCRWAAANRAEHLAADARRSERINRRIAENQARARKHAAEDEAAAARAEPGIALQAAMHPPEIPLSHEAPYELAPEDDGEDDAAAGPGRPSGEEPRKSS